MARKSSKKNDRGGSRVDWPRIIRIAATVTTVLLITGTVVGLLIGRGPLQARALEVSAQPVRVVFDWPPLAQSRSGAAASRSGTWVDPHTQAQLESFVLAHVSTADPFDMESLAKARETLAATGWFASGLTVRRQDAATVRVEGRWRIPFAVVRHGQHDWLVTYHGERLDRSYAQNASGLPVIFGASQPPPKRLGDRWAGAEVQAGLVLLSVLRSRPWADQLAGVDVSDFNAQNRRQLALVARSGSRIRWGGPADQPLPGEEPTAIKLRHLDELVARTGRVDGGASHVDVRFQVAQARDPAAAEGGAVQSPR